MSVVEVRKQGVITPPYVGPSSRVPPGMRGLSNVRSSRAVRAVGSSCVHAHDDDENHELDYRPKILQKIFERCAYKGQRDMPWGSGAPFSAGVENGQEALASTTYTSRAGQDIPDAAFIETAEYTNPISSNFTYQAQGITTAQYFPLSIIRFYLAYHRLLQAERVGDVEGQKLAKADMATKLFSIAGGLSYAIARPLSLAATITHVSASGFNAPTQLGSAAFAVPTVGIWLFCIAGAISSVKSGWSIYKGLNLQSKLAKIEGEQDKIAYLKSLLEPTAEELEQIKAASDKELQEEALKQGTEELFSLVKELSEEPNSNIQALSLKQCRKLLEELTPSVPGDKIIEQGIKVRLANLRLKKELQLARIIGDEGVKMIKTGRNPIVTLDTIDLHIDGQRIISWLNIAANVFNTIGVILAIVVLVWVTGGFGLLALSYIAAVASFLYGGTGLILDAYACKKGLETAKPGPWDKGLLTVGVIANWVSFIVGVAFMYLLAGPIVPGALAIAIGLFLFLNVMHYYTWSKTRDNKEFNVAKFSKEFEANPTDDAKIGKLFAKLTTKEQEVIADTLRTNRERTNTKREGYSPQELRAALSSFDRTYQEREEEERRKKAALMASLSSVVNGFLKQRQLASA